jgi:diguanylate cyclase (GGDEF)-like protein/PAS domain S-box-containing protein
VESGLALAELVDIQAEVEARSALDRARNTSHQEAERAQEELRSALEQEELQPWFMPLVDLRSGSLRGYEALARWLRRDGRVELPEQFLPLARRYGLEERLDRQMLRQSIQALAALPASLSISANLGATSLGSADLADAVGRWLKEATVAPQRLHLEITETALLLMDPQVRITIQNLAELGVRLVLDDFGTGFSSISHLRDLPLHGLKLDRSFTEAIRRGDQKSVRLAQALAGLAEGLELDTVAEGIEYPDDVTNLRALGWHCGQGWHYGQAAPLSHWQGGLGPITPADPADPTADTSLVAPLSRQTWALAVTDNVPVGLFALHRDHNGRSRLQFVSRRCLELLQLRREQVDDLTTVLSRVNPEDRKRLVTMWRQGNLDSPLSWEGRLQLWSRDSWVSIEATPIPQADGSTVWEGVLTDISKQRQGLEQLEQERALLETVLTHIDAHVYMKDRQGRYLYANPCAMELLSRNGSAVLGRSDEELLPVPVAATFRAADQRAWATSGALEIEEHIPQPDGSERIFLSKKLAYRQPGQPDALIGFSTEITGLRQTSEQLAASEEHYRLLAENSTNVVFRLDDQGRILWVSPSLTTLLGWRPEEWVGQIGTQFLVHQGRSEEYQANRTLLRATDGATAVAREQIRAKDGSIHWIETHAGPYRNARGELDGVVASFRTIDVEMEAEQELLRSEERYRLLAEYARDVIWTMEPDGRISYVSPSIELLRGISAEEAMTQPLEQIHPPASLQRSRQYFVSLLADLEAGRPTQPFRGELEYFRRDGSTIWTEVMALPVLDGEGRLAKLIGVSRDITERKYYEQQLEAMATTDSLTGIANRRHIEALVQGVMAQADRYGEPLSLILFDIDHFKTVNDERGHQAGDQVLVEFSQRIRQHLRSSDSFARWGGEEFLILLPKTDLPAATALAEQLRQLVIASPFAAAGSLTASFGVAQHIRHEPEAAWFRRVDECLYAAKRAGRNRVVHVPPPC